MELFAGKGIGLSILIYKLSFYSIYFPPFQYHNRLVIVYIHTVVFNSNQIK